MVEQCGLKQCGKSPLLMGKSMYSKSTFSWQFSIAMLNYRMVISGWWYTYPSEKYEFVKWDYYSQLNGKS